ncbi:MAG: SURF1 family protein [Lentilitoribacter sp.]
MHNSATSKSRIIAVLVFLILAAVFATLIVLGSWQMKRLEWKETLLTNIELRLASRPISLPALLELSNAGEEFEYQPVSVTGVFDHTKERHFFATHNGFSGYYVYTPLMGDFGVIFINRGFVPFDFKEPTTRLEGQIDGAVTVIGLARKMLDEKPSSVVPENDLDKNIYYWKDLRSMVQTTGLSFDDPKLLKFFVDADETPNPGGFPQGGVTLIDLPNNHLQYAFTWYGLAATLLCIVVIFLFRRKTTGGVS